MRRSDDLRRVRRLCFALMMAAILVLCAGCSGAGSIEPAGEEPETHEETEQSGQPAGDDSAYSAYRDVLLENEYKIMGYYWQADSNGDLVDEYAFDEEGRITRPDHNTNKCIAFADINNDGTDEMLFMSAENDSLANLHIYRYDADLHEAVEIYYDYPSRFLDGQGYMSDAAVAGGSRYMVFTGTEPGTLYMAYIITDEVASSDMTEFTCTPDGEITRNWTAKNNYSNYDKSDVYFLNDEEVPEEEGSSYFVQGRKNYGKLIMFSGYTDIMSVFENVRSDNPAAMCFDDAMDWLDARI